MYPFLVENMADEEAYIQNLNIEVNSKEVCYFMCGEILDGYFLKSFADIKIRKQERYLYVIKTGLIWTKIVVLF